VNDAAIPVFHLPAIVAISIIIFALAAYPLIFWTQGRFSETKLPDALKVAAQSVTLTNALKTILIIVLEAFAPKAELTLNMLYGLYGSWAVIWLACITLKGVFISKESK
jgi:hypothetical protein